MVKKIIWVPGKKILEFFLNFVGDVLNLINN